MFPGNRRLRRARSQTSKRVSMKCLSLHVRQETTGSQSIKVKLPYAGLVHSSAQSLELTQQLILASGGFVGLPYAICECMLNHLYLAPLAVLVDMFLGTRRARVPKFKEHFHECLSLPVDGDSQLLRSRKRKLSAG